MIVQSCLNVNALQSLLHQEVPVDILKFILKQISKILEHDAAARQELMITGGLRKIQEIVITDKELEELINGINSYYPEDITKHYTPNNPNTIVERIDEFRVKAATTTSDACLEFFEKQLKQPVYDSPPLKTPSTEER
jgi:hypothetical protein